MDNGLLGGLAEGIKQGMASYSDARKQKQEQDNFLSQQAMQKRAQQISMLGSGIQDNAAGGLEFTPDVQAQKDLSLQENKAKAKEFDPNAPQAKAYGDVLKKFGGPTTAEPLSAYESKGLIDPLEKYAGIQMKSQELAQNRQIAGDAKKEALIAKQRESLQNALDPARMRSGAFGAMETKRNAIKGASVLFDQYPDNNIPATATRELSSSVAGLLGNGSSSSVHQINELVPDSLHGDANRIASWFIGEPRGLEQQKFIQGLKDTVSRERNLANQTMLGYISRKKVPYDSLANTDPEAYNNIINGNAAEYGFSREDLDKYTKEHQSGTFGQKPQQMGLIGQAGPDGGLINSANAGAGQVDPEMQALLAEKKRRSQSMRGR